MREWADEIRKRIAGLNLDPVREAEIVEELAQHLEDRYQELRGAGAMEWDAHRKALDELSENEVLARELRRIERQVTEESDLPGFNGRSNMIAGLSQDLRYGARMLFKAPGFTFVAVLTLALGIGANTAIFSVVNAVLLRPLPYAESERLVFVSERNQQSERVFVSWPNYQDWRANNGVFDHIGVYNLDSYNLIGDGEPERLLAGQVSADLFAALRADAEFGRVFSNEQDKPGAEPVVVLSHGLWQRRFGGNASVLDRPITLNERRYTVIGVMPPDFQFPNRVELWVPAGQLSGKDWQQRGNHPGLYGVARLKPGVTLDQARTELDTIALGLEKQYPGTNRDYRVALTPLLATVIGDVSWGLWVLLAAASFVLAVACANVANLLLVRSAVRQREMAIRAALGASRTRLVRQLLTESVMLALLGGGAGLLLANWTVSLLVSGSAGNLPRAAEVRLDARVLAFALGVSVLTGVLFGLAPAWQMGRVSLQQTLKERGPSLIGVKQRTGSALVIAEMALALILLVGAGLLVRSFYLLNKVDAGFVYENLLSFSLTLPERKYGSLERRTDFYTRLSRKMADTPGVQSVGLTSGLPFGRSSWRNSFVVEGRPIPPPGEMPVLEACLVSPDYFRTMGIPLRAGRFFTDQDNRQHLAGRDLSSLNEGAKQAAGLNALVIDEEFARRYWPNEDAVGERIRLGPVDAGSPVLTVVGVVGRVKMDKLSAESNRVQAYISCFQLAFSNITVVIKSAVEPSQMIAAARQQVQTLDTNQPIYNLKTLEQARSDSIAPERLNLTLLSLFAALALVLAAVGIYGVVSYGTTQRKHEIGIRLALGAPAAEVLKLVVRQGMKPVLIGLSIGLLASLALTRLLKSLLFGISSTDPLTFVAIAILLTGVALTACYLPARRATKVDPMVALRYE
ncbi:MAG: ABC transporter permease [Blastocatellia bacterium]